MTLFSPCLRVKFGHFEPIFRVHFAKTHLSPSEVDPDNMKMLLVRAFARINARNCAHLPAELLVQPIDVIHLGLAFDVPVPQRDDPFPLDLHFMHACLIAFGSHCVT